MIPCTNVAGGYAAGDMTTARRAVIFATSLLTITSKNRLLAGQVLPWTLGSLARPLGQPHLAGISIDSGPPVATAHH